MHKGIFMRNLSHLKKQRIFKDQYGSLYTKNRASTARFFYIKMKK